MVVVVVVMVVVVVVVVRERRFPSEQVSWLEIRVCGSHDCGAAACTMAIHLKQAHT